MQDQFEEARTDINEIPSRRETLGEALSSMFAGSGNGLQDALTLAVGIVSLGWLADSLLPLLNDASILIIAKLRGQSAGTKFTDALIKSLIPVLWFTIFISFLYFRRRRNLQPLVYNSVVPEPHKGLIVMLSKYSPMRGQESYETPVEIAQATSAGSLDLNKVFAGCNWGQLAFVVRYHASTLQRCWVIVTENSSEKKKDGSKDESEHAEKLIGFLTKKERVVCCEIVVIKNPNDIGETAKAISHIYHGLTQTGSTLQPRDVIADFTGGTSAMSGGMILATLDEGREIEYVIRGVTLGSDMTPQQVREHSLIISPRTSLRMAQIFARKM